MGSLSKLERKGCGEEKAGGGMMREREEERMRVNEKTIWSVVSYVSSKWASLSRL